MKLKFESLDYQDKAVDSVVKIFENQERLERNFTVKSSKNQEAVQGTIKGIEMEESTVGVGNKLGLTKEEILDNVRNVQIQNNLPISEKLSSMDFTVEMETGTGKTFVYIKTIYELYKNYNFRKFIIVVPSIAIKEGVYKTFEITKEHFKSFYESQNNFDANVNYFIYDSSNVDKVRNFATSTNIEIMIINIDAFRKGFDENKNDDKANIIHRRIDSLNGDRPIDLIKQTNPIVIIDEPQSVDTTEKSKEAIKSLNPLCTLRYSATHIEKYNMVYKLDAIDAYNQNLVKKIEVLSLRSDESFNTPYLKLLSVDKNKAKIEIEAKDNKSGNIKRVKKTVKQGDDLFDLSGNRDLYENKLIKYICWEDGNEYITIEDKNIFVGEVVGDFDQDELKRVQIRKTIEEHLKKEIELNKQGIKVLSLFFIDKVLNYREYDKDGNVICGKYQKMFVEEYKNLIKQERFKDNVNIKQDTDEIHNGYFSVDKKGKLKDTNGTSQADEDVYSLIMKDKEKLLDMKNPLRFIFSHSALKEGWDNPNVFQICTLKESTGTYTKRRQEIGRGLRLCVDQKGDRIHDKDVNLLTVIANESYSDFVKGIQSELEDDLKVKFGFVKKNSFSKLYNEKEIFGEINSEKFYDYLFENEYIDTKGKITDKLKSAFDEGNFSLKNTEFSDFELDIKKEIKSLCESYTIKDASKKKKITLNKEMMLNEDFLNLWEKINTKTKYNVNFDEDELIKNCVDKIKEMEKIQEKRIFARKDRLDKIKLTQKLTTKSVYAEQKEGVIANKYLPNILVELQNQTNLTRKSIIEILTKSDRLDDFKVNPQKFIEVVSKIIKTELNKLLVKGIKYEKINDHYCICEIDKDFELNIDEKMLIKSEKSIYTDVCCDSNVEISFAKKFEEDNRVKCYFKLKDKWFKIDTPFGKFTPDWAVVTQKNENECEKLYFVIETKGSKHEEDLRFKEKAKIDCAKKHFEAINSGICFKGPENDVDEFFRDNV